MSTNKFLLFFLLVLTSLPAVSVVDMKNANYASTWTDLEVPGSGYDLKVVRTYNSRSLFNGIFGFGWCSDFETSLDVTAEGNLRVRECGGGMEVLYSPREISQKEIETTVSQILSKMKEGSKTGMTSAHIAALKKELFIDDAKRAEMAKENGIKVQIKQGTRFYANGREVEYFTVNLDKKTYDRFLADSTKQVFNFDGKMIQMNDKNNNYLAFKYDKGQLVEIRDNNSRSLQLKYFPSKKIHSILGPNNLRADYDFSEVDHLSAVRDAWQKTVKYKYDKNHNLILISWPDKTTVKIDYNEQNDWVTGFKDRDNCQETYNYEFDPKDSNHYWSTVKKVCGKETVASNKYEFWYQTRGDGKPFLARVRTEEGGRTTDISYDNVFGKPVSINRNQDRSTFEYYPNGLVKKKSGPNLNVEYFYEKDSKKVSKVEASFLDEKGKVINKTSTTFKYDAKGNLFYAENSLGQKIHMTHDPKGRITTIKDQAKKIVKIQYEERFGKPTVISRPGLGTITVKYKANGDIDQVDSKEGPSVVRQVASAFNNLLDVISPATDELYL